MTGTIAVVTLVTALGSGLVAGVFYAFSTFVMRSLAALPPAQAVAAMQSINVQVICAAFLGPFLGTGVLGAALCAATVLWWPGSAGLALLAGAALYLLGTLFVTIAFNVPRNDALAAVDAQSPAAADLWSRYLREWTAWNHVRTLAAVAATVILLLAWRQLGGAGG